MSSRDRSGAWQRRSSGLFFGRIWVPTSCFFAKQADLHHESRVLRVPRKSPGKRLRVRVNDKISMTLRKMRTGFLLAPVKILLAIRRLEKIGMQAGLATQKPGMFLYPVLG